MCQGRESPTAEGVMVGTPKGGLESFTKLPTKRDFKEVSKTGTPRAHQLLWGPVPTLEGRVIFKKKRNYLFGCVGS